MLKLLIADDSSLMRRVIYEKLKVFDEVFVISQAVNGVMALDMFRSMDPDVIILDLHMPDLNGIQVLKEIKKSKPETTVCILTNYPYPQYRKKCLAFGADYFFNKNEDFENLNNVIADIIRKKEDSRHMDPI